MSDKPNQPLLPPQVVPPKPSVSSQHEWNMLSAEEQARSLFEWGGFWLDRLTPAIETPSGAHIVIPTPSRRDNDDWKQPPTDEERASMLDYENRRKYS